MPDIKVLLDDGATAAGAASAIDYNENENGVGKLCSQASLIPWYWQPGD